MFTSKKALVLLCLLPGLRATPQSRDVVVASTTSTRDTGLLDSLLPIFTARTGYRVQLLAVGTGQALTMGRRGDADVVLVHAPEAERVLVDSGYFVRRLLVMHNEFLIVGPAADPAGLRGMPDAAAALLRLAEHRAVFVSRADNSGTEQRERMLWQKAGRVQPRGEPWYIEAGQGMGATLQMASEKRAYTLTDIGTYLAWQSKVELVPLVQGDPALFNVYHVLEPNPRNAPRINVAGGRAFADFMVDTATQRLIGQFGTTRFGRPLFIPDAGKIDRW